MLRGPQVQELRLQVRALQMVSGLSDGGGSEGDGGNGGGGAPPLEAMLVERARRCEHDATVARLAAAEAQGEARTTPPPPLPHPFLLRLVL